MLGSLKDGLQLVDESGKVVAICQPVAAPRASPAASPFTEAEINEPLDPSERGRALPDILAELGAL
jgi:hypothetical protein